MAVSCGRLLDTHMQMLSGSARRAYEFNQSVCRLVANRKHPYLHFTSLHLLTARFRSVFRCDRRRSLRRPVRSPNTWVTQLGPPSLSKNDKQPQCFAAAIDRAGTVSVDQLNAGV